MHPLVELAKLSIESFVREKKVIEPPQELASQIREKAGVFVSIKKKGNLRGCIGTFAPTTENVAYEVIRNSIEASTRDPRFSPVQEDELDDLDVSVDVLTQPERIAALDELDAKKYGVIVKSGARRGLLLPDLPGVSTPKQQVAICMQKGGIGPKDPIELYRFEVKRYK